MVRIKFYTTCSSNLWNHVMSQLSQKLKLLGEDIRHEWFYFTSLTECMQWHFQKKNCYFSLEQILCVKPKLRSPWIYFRGEQILHPIAWMKLIVVNTSLSSSVYFQCIWLFNVFSDIEGIHCCCRVRGGICNKPIFCGGNMLNHLFGRLYIGIKGHKDCVFYLWTG